MKNCNIKIKLKSNLRLLYKKKREKKRNYFPCERPSHPYCSSEISHDSRYDGPVVERKKDFAHNRKKKKSFLLFP